MTRTRTFILGFLALSTPAIALNTACYNSLGSLTPSHTTTEYQSVALCQQFCNAENKPVYAVQDKKCFCGDTLPPLEAKVENTECMTRCPGYPAENCGGQATYTIGTSKRQTQRAIYTAPVTDAETRSETEANGILTAPDVDEGDADPLASLSVNPTMVRTASNAPTGTDTPKSILTASAQPSSTMATSAATVAPTASASASSLSSSASTSGVASPSASVATGAAAAGRGVGREMVLGGIVAGLVVRGLF